MKLEKKYFTRLYEKIKKRRIPELYISFKKFISLL